MAFVDVRDPRTGKLLFRFDASRDLVEIAERGQKTLVDLAQYRDIGDRKQGVQDGAIGH